MRARRALSLLAAGSSVIALSALGGASGPLGPDDAATDGGPPIRIDELTPSAEPVTAVDVWTETIDAASCMAGAGLTVIGPLPTADGMATWYAIQAEPTALAVEERCTEDLIPAAMRFGIDRSEHQSSILREIRGSIEACVEAKGVVLDRSLDETAPDTGMQDAAHTWPRAFEECARTIPIPG